VYTVFITYYNERNSMLSKWQKSRPTKFSGNYSGLPSRWDLSQVLLGMYNACWSYQQVAEYVSGIYSNSERQMRAELITSALIAHRRKKMLTGMDGVDFSALVKNRLAQIETRRVLLEEIETRKELVGL